MPSIPMEQRNGSLPEMLKKDFDQITEDMVAEHKEELYKELKSVEQIEWIPDKQEL